MRRSAFVPLFALLLAGCGDAVTDPSREGFAGNPRIIEGDWVTIFRTQAGVDRYNAELLPAGGEFLGEFTYFRAGRITRIAFNDGLWDGERLEFTTDPLPGTSGTEPIEWTALYIPPGSGGSDDPAQLRLMSAVIGGAAFPVLYVRPADLDWLENR